MSKHANVDEFAAEEQPKPEEQTMAHFLDQLIAEGMEIEKIAAEAQIEGLARGLRTKYTRGTIQGHIKFREKQTAKKAALAAEQLKNNLGLLNNKQITVLNYNKIFATTSNDNKTNYGGIIIDKFKAKAIIQNAVEFTKPRWSQYDESWSNIDVSFILRGYEQQGFQFFKMKPILEDLSILSINSLGNILMKYPHKRSYERQFAGSLSTEFYLGLQKGICDKEGKLFVEAVRIFLDKKIGNPGRTFWKLLYQMLQACAFLKQNYSSSFAKYVISKYASFSNKRYLSEKDFLNITVAEWELFLIKAKPWRELMGIGPNVFDFVLGDIVEAQFVENSYKFDSSNQHFLTITGIAQLIVPFDREATIFFLKDLKMPFNLREINRGIYTYCSKTENANYGYCRDRNKCNMCKVEGICNKIFI